MQAPADATIAAEGSLRTLGPFQLTGLLGRGGMGEVWAARHERSGEALAVKIVQLGGGPGFVRAFNREVRAVAGLDHPGIVRVFDRGEDDNGAPWLAMERAEAGLDYRQPRTWHGLRDAITQILAALAHAHARGVIHRDIKPSNALWIGERLVLADFGLAWAPDDGGGRAVGSPGFMSPEQATGRWRAFGPWTDLYALAASLWELASGSPLFTRDSLRQVLLAQVHDEPGPFDPGFPVPDEFEAWLRVCLAKSPSDRFASAAAALAALPGGAVVGSGPMRRVTRALTTMSFSGSAALAEEPGHDSNPTATPTGRQPLPRDWRTPPHPSRWVPGLGLGLLALRTVPLIGREALQDQLWDRLAAIERGGTLALHGAAGVGKSRLAEWLVWRSLECGAVAVLDLRDGLAEGLRRRLRARDLDAAQLAARARVLGIRLADPLAAWLCWEDLPSTRMQIRLALDAIEALASEGSLVVWVEEPSATELQLLAALDLPGVMALVTSREPVQIAGTESLAVPPLGPDASRELVRELLLVDGGVAEQLVRRSQGVPLFAVRLVSDWVERGWLLAGDQGFELAPDAATVVPDDLHDLWSAALDRCLAEDRSEHQAVESMAEFPEPLSIAAWIELAGRLGVGDPHQTLERLADGGLLQIDNGEARIRHALLRESLARRLEERADPHAYGLLGEVFSSNEEWSRFAGRCLLLAGRLPEARTALFSALRSARRIHDWDQCVEIAALLDLALEGLAEDAPEREQADAHEVVMIAFRRPPDADARLDGFFAKAKRLDWSVLEGRVWHARASIALVAGDLELALALSERSLVLAQRVQDEMLIRGAVAVLGSTAIALGRLDRAEQAYRLALGRWQSDDAVLALAEIALGRGDLAEARSLMGQVAFGADPIVRVNHAMIGAELAWEEGHPARALEPLENAEEILQALGHDELLLPRMLRALSLSLLDRGPEGAPLLRGVEDPGGEYGLVLMLARAACGARSEMAAIKVRAAQLSGSATSSLGHAARAAGRTARSQGWSEDSAWLDEFAASQWARLERPPPAE